MKLGEGLSATAPPSSHRTCTAIVAAASGTWCGPGTISAVPRRKSISDGLVCRPLFPNRESGSIARALLLGSQRQPFPAIVDRRAGERVERIGRPMLPGFRKAEPAGRSARSRALQAAAAPSLPLLLSSQPIGWSFCRRGACKARGRAVQAGQSLCS